MKKQLKVRIHFALVAIAAFVASACDNPSTISTIPRNATDSSGTPNVSTELCTSPATRVIDYGERATTGATMGVRGAFSDMAFIPGTSHLGAVYTDAGSVSLRYTFFDGGKNVTETIAGGLTANFVRLVYLSSGRPLVFWANASTAVFMAARSTASLTDQATWTVTAIDTQATMVTRSLEASVNAADQVAVFYVNSANTSARVVLCSANCHLAANYSGMGAIGNFITNTASASNNAADIKWCNAGSGVYYPYVVYGGTANSVIARCANATLANCLTPANWSSTTITDGTNATGANQVMTRLAIDSAADQPFAVVARRSTNEVRAYKQNAGGCASGALAFSASSAAIGSGATLANSYGHLARDSAGRWHLTANDGTTNIRYFNELTGNITAAWNANSTIETTTMAAVGAARGSLAVDETGNQVLVSYGRTTGGTPAQSLGNLVLAFNTCPAAGTGCGATTLASPSNAAGMLWENAPLDTTGQILPITGQIPSTIAVAATSAGTPAVAYVDFSVGSVTTGRLKYALRAGSSTGDAWPGYDVPPAVSPQAVGLIFDTSNHPWISYYDASSLRYYLSSTSATDGSTGWLNYQFPFLTANAPTLPAANGVALVLTTIGGAEKPLMIASNSGAATKVIRSAVFNPATQSWSNSVQIDSGTANFSRLSADADRNGNVVLAYYDTTNLAIKFTYSTDGGATWATPATIITGSGGMGVTVKLNPVTSLPALAFYDRALSLVRYKFCASTLASCLTPASWSNVGSGVIEGSAGIGGLTTAATDGLLLASLSFSAGGDPFLVYSVGATGAPADLKMSYVSSGAFNTPQTLNAGSNGNLTGAVAANFAMGGWMPASVRTVTGSLHTVYVGPGNFLYVTSCGN